MKQMKVRLLRGREMKAGIVSILLALILALISYLPVVAQDDSTGTITITMTGAKEVSITVNPTNWSPPEEEGGKVKPNTSYETAQERFTLTAAGSNCNVNTFIAGDDAVCVADSTYKWELSNDRNNAKGMYVLKFQVSGEASDVVITKTARDFCPPHGQGSSLTPTDSIQFGLKLLTPSPDFTKDGVGYFSVGDATMETHITISAVAA